MPRPPARLYELDLLRFGAALSVMLYHYTCRGYAAGAYRPVAFAVLGRVTQYGYLGVELFFLISGFVVLLSAQGKGVGEFVVSRAARLYPAFWVACTLTFVVLYAGGHAAGVALPPALQVTPAQYAYNMTLLSSSFSTSYIDGVYWSLAVEITFYFLVSLLLAYRLLPRLDLFISLWLSYVVLAGLRVAAPGTLLAALLLPDYAPYFAAGMLFYLLQTPQGRTWRRYTLLAAAYLLAVRASVLQAGELPEPFRSASSPGVVAGIVTIFFGVFYLIAIRKLSLPRQAWLARLGALTYPLYLMHGAVGFFLFYRLGPVVNKYALLGSLVLGMVGASYVIHVLIERPLGQALRAHLTKRLLSTGTVR